MNPVIDRLKLIFLGVFLVINAGVAVWEFGWQLPRQNCEKAGKWWDNADRLCGTPILTSDVTGRMIDNPQAKVEALQAIGRPVPASLQKVAAAQAQAQAQAAKAAPAAPPPAKPQ
jgi:hypothetical protein